MNNSAWTALALMGAMQDPSFGASHLNKFEQDPRVTELFNACVEYYRTTKNMNNRECQPHSDKLRALRFKLGLSAKDLRGCKQSAERHLINLGEIKR